MTQASPHDSFTCLDLRRAKLAEPTRLPAQAHTHLADCPACQDFCQRIDAGEKRAAAALDVVVPEGLAERVLLRTSATRPRPAWRLAAMAAAVVASIGVGIAEWLPAERLDYAHFAIDHVRHEPESFATRRLADPRAFHAVMARFGGEIRAPIGKVRYMKLCPVPGGTGWHIVIDTDYGPATLILIPGQALRAIRLEAEMEGLMATARPGGDGYYVVVTDSQEALIAIERLLDERVRWRA